MEYLSATLPIILYIVAIILIIVLIVVGFKLITILDKVDKICDSVDKKVSSFDNAFTVLSKAVDGVANIGESVMFGVSSAISKVFNRKNKEDRDYE